VTTTGNLSVVEFVDAAGVTLSETPVDIGREGNHQVSFDLEKLQAVAELGEVIRLQNEALERLAAFRKERPYLMMPNLAKMVEENIKENVTVLYKELNNLHKPAAQQTRYICRECQMAFVVSLPGGICDECRARLGSKPRSYELPVITAEEEDVNPQVESESGMLDETAATSDSAMAEAAEDVAHDLSVAEPVDVTASDAEVPSDETETHVEEENVYELSMDDDSDLSMEPDDRKSESES